MKYSQIIPVVIKPPPTPPLKGGELDQVRFLIFDFRVWEEEVGLDYYDSDFPQVKNISTFFQIFSGSNVKEMALNVKVQGFFGYFQSYPLTRVIF